MGRYFHTRFSIMSVEPASEIGTQKHLCETIHQLFNTDQANSPNVLQNERYRKAPHSITLK